MKTNLIPIFQADAFTTGPFTGNPAAVCLLHDWLPDETMQKIAQENNLAETAFLVEDHEGYLIRWFTPAVEVDLCGHGTLASAFVVFDHLRPGSNRVNFSSLRKGILTVTKKGEMLELDFPTDTLTACTIPDLIIDGLKVRPVESVMGGSDYLIRLDSEEDVLDVTPDFRKLCLALK